MIENIKDLNLKCNLLYIDRADLCNRREKMKLLELSTFPDMPLALELEGHFKYAFTIYRVSHET